MTERRYSASFSSEGEGAEYVAKGRYPGKGRSLCLDLRLADGSHRAVEWVDMRCRILNAEGSQIAFFCGFEEITINGRNLYELYLDMLKADIDWIRVFDPEKWEKPRDPNAMVIETIEISLRER